MTQLFPGWKRVEGEDALSGTAAAKQPAQLCSVRLWTADEGQTRDGVLSSLLFLAMAMRASCQSVSSRNHHRSRVLAGPKRDGDQSSPGCALAIPGGPVILVTKKKKGEKKKKGKGKEKEKSKGKKAD